MSFPRRPSRNEDPWYAAREAYDQAIEDGVERSLKRRGGFAASSDYHMDDLRGAEWAGIWHAPWNSSLRGLPFSLTQRTQIRIYDPGHSNTHSQVVEDAFNSYWRQYRVNEWGPWHKNTGAFKTNGFLENLIDHIDEASGSNFNGVWSIPFGTSIEGLPFPIRQRTQVRVFDSGHDQAQTQVVEDAFNSYWRQSRIGSWGEWISYGAPLTPTSVVAELDSNGELINAIGDPHAIFNNGISSITKVMTSLTSYDLGVSFDSVATVEAQDLTNGDGLSGSLQVGDELTIRDLHHLAMVVSDNIAPNVIARHSAQEALGASRGDAWDRFVTEMNTKIYEILPTGPTSGRFTTSISKMPPSFSKPVGGGHLSAYQTAYLVFHYNSIPALREIVSVNTYSFNISGPNQRSRELTSLSRQNMGGFMGQSNYIGGKTGASRGRAHIAFTWVNGSGIERTTAMLNSVSSNRYSEAHQAVRYSRSGDWPQNHLLDRQRDGVDVADGVDLNDLIYPGIYGLRQNRSFVNIPEEVDASTISAALEVKVPDIGSLAIVQELTHNQAKYFRTVRSRNNREWRPWHKVSTETVDTV